MGFPSENPFDRVSPREDPQNRRGVGAAQQLCTTRCTTGSVFAAQRSGATIPPESPAGLVLYCRIHPRHEESSDTPCRPGPVGWPAPQQRARPGPTPAASHPKGHHDIDGPQSCDRNSHTSHPDPTGRDRPVPRADSPHARFAGATDNGRRERPDGPIWISVSICGQTPQS